jgi:hypothetical protein
VNYDCFVSVYIELPSMNGDPAKGGSKRERSQDQTQKCKHRKLQVNKAICKMLAESGGGEEVS